MMILFGLLFPSVLTDAKRSGEKREGESDEEQRLVLDDRGVVQGVGVVVPRPGSQEEDGGDDEHLEDALEHRLWMRNKERKDNVLLVMVVG